ncbi:hypothetical protein Tco_1153434 [Tanacetum coccineum]
MEVIPDKEEVAINDVPLATKPPSIGIKGRLRDGGGGGNMEVVFRVSFHSSNFRKCDHRVFRGSGGGGGGGGGVFGVEVFGGSVVFSGDGVGNGVGGVVCGVACGVVWGLSWSHGAEGKDSFVKCDMTGNDDFVGVQVKASISMMIGDVTIEIQGHVTTGFELQCHQGDQGVDAKGNDYYPVSGVVLGLANVKTWDEIVQKIKERPLGNSTDKGKGKEKV